MFLYVLHKTSVSLRSQTINCNSTSLLFSSCSALWWLFILAERFSFSYL